VVLLKGGDMRISQVPWKPVERVPRSSTPVVDEDSTHCRPRRSPSASARASAKPRDPLFRGSVTRPTFSLCTLRRRGYPSSTQHSLPGGGVPPCLDGAFTRWVSLLSFCSWISYIRGLLSARACLAHRTAAVGGLAAGEFGDRCDAFPLRLSIRCAQVVGVAPMAKASASATT
jgi:hypothetical protein